jgi:hypothetical protein
VKDIDMKFSNKIINSMRLKQILKDIECSIGKKFLHDIVLMEGIVDIVNGNRVVHGKNSVVGQGLIGLIDFLSGVNFVSNSGASVNWSTITTYSYMVIGSDTVTGTTSSTTALTTPIGSGTGTKPNTQSGATSNPATGQWQVQWTATWNPGTVSGTLGEVGLYLFIQPTLMGFGGQVNQALNSLFSRMAVADGKFSSFSINATVPLSIAWTFKLTYAT